MLATPVSSAMTCWVRSASAHGFFGRQREGLVLAVGVQALRAAQDSGQGLKRHADDVVIALLGRERNAAGLRVETEHHAFGLGGLESLFHDPCIEPPGGAELGDFFEEIAV